MNVIRTIVLTCLGGLLPTAAVGQTIVWTDNNARRIQRKEVNGADVQTIVQFPSSPSASRIHYDPIGAKLYYRLGTAFERSNLDGTDPETIPTPSVGNFTLNVELRKLYWVNSGQSPSTVYRSALDGTGVESHTYSTCCINTLEAVGDDLFFGAGGVMLKGIWRADADGANEQFLHGAPSPQDLGFDPVENKLYVATEAIYRMNTDGTSSEQIVKLQSLADQIVVDSRRRKVYWGRGNVIQRSNLDGSNVEDFVTVADVGNPDFTVRGLTIVYSSKPIPTVSGWGLTAMTAILLLAGLFVLRRQFNLKGTTNVQYPQEMRDSHLFLTSEGETPVGAGA